MKDFAYKEQSKQYALFLITAQQYQLLIIATTQQLYIEYIAVVHFH